MDLSAAAAGHAGDHSCALFRASAVANFAKFQTRQTDFRIHPRSRFFKTYFNLIAEFLPALGTLARAAPSEKILERKETPKSILNFIHNLLSPSPTNSPP